MNETWTTLPWQEPLWQQVTASIATGRLAHALMLVGSRGVGKRHFSKGLASYLLCEARTATGPCGQCRSCIQLAAGTHPNLMVLRPEEGRRDISIDAVREMSARLALSSHYGQAKVVVVDPADALNLHGINALLKTIEEPPPATHLVLISERPMTLPATLRSRCQILRFCPPSTDLALSWLRSQHPEADPGRLRPWLRAPLRAGEMLTENLQKQREDWRLALMALAEGKLDALRIAREMGKEEALGFFEWLMEWGTGQLRARLGAAPGMEQPTAAAPLRLQPAGLDRLLRETATSVRQLANNGSAPLLVESIMIRWWQLARSGAA